MAVRFQCYVSFNLMWNILFIFFVSVFVLPRIMQGELKNVCELYLLNGLL